MLALEMQRANLIRPPKQGLPMRETWVMAIPPSDGVGYSLFPLYNQACAFLVAHLMQDTPKFHAVFA